MKYDNELRTGGNVKQIVYRALQIAHSDPKGPVYLVGAREVMEEETEPVTIDRRGLAADRADAACRSRGREPRRRASPAASARWS